MTSVLPNKYSEDISRYIAESFDWALTGEGLNWLNATDRLSYGGIKYGCAVYDVTICIPDGGKGDMNDVGEIVVPDYEEKKWMPTARLKYMRFARDGIKTAFDWNATKEGYNYWKEVYVKLYIMCEHMEIYAVFARLNGQPLQE